MHSEFIYKMQVVSKNGLMLAEVPQSEDITTSQLSGGILSAIMSFSQEVHKRDVESISYHDRTIIFAPMNEVFLVAEVSSTLNQEILDRLIHLLKTNSRPYLEFVGGSSLNTIQAQEQLNQIVESDWFHKFLENLGLNKPLVNASKVTFTLDSEFALKQNSGEQSITAEIVDTIVNHKKYKIDPPIYCGYIMLTKFNKAAFVLGIRNNGFRGGYLLVDDQAINALFKLTPLLAERVRNSLSEDPELNIEEFLEKLSNIHDVSQRYEDEDEVKQNKIGMIDKMIKGLDQVIYSVLVGNQVLVVGEKSKVDLVIEVLNMFTVHQLTETVKWLDSDEIGRNLTGLSKEKFLELKSAGKIDDKVLVVDLDENTISGENRKSSKFISRLCARTSKLTYRQAMDTIKSESDLIVNYAINATSYTPLEKEQLLNSLADLKSDIGNRAQYDLIQDIAAKQNTWLYCVINDQTYDEFWI